MEHPALEGLFAKPMNHAKREELAKKMANTPKVSLPGVKRADPRKLWDNYQEVAVIQKSERLRFVIAACTREGYRCINIREFYYVKRDDIWKPGRDGIMIPIAAPLKKTRRPDPNNPPKIIYPMQEMLLALTQAVDVAVDMDLEDPENEVWLMPKATAKETEE